MKVKYGLSTALSTHRNIIKNQQNKLSFHHMENVSFFIMVWTLLFSTCQC